MTNILQKTIEVFSCPICQSEMNISGGSLVCALGHSYDIAKAGYVNFLTRPVKTDYSKKMLGYRREVIEAGFFKPLLDEAVSCLGSVMPGYILDAGCGEGSQLAYIVSQLGNNINAVGADISKDGVIAGAKSYKNIAYIAGDIAGLPLKDESISGIVNILSPANYSEFNRILKPGGLLIKVVPNADYLKELRQIFFEDSNKANYTNDSVVEIFKSNYPQCSSKDIKYSFPVSRDILEKVVAMSPLSWRANPQQIELVFKAGITAITVDFKILTVRKDV